MSLCRQENKPSLQTTWELIEYRHVVRKLKVAFWGGAHRTYQPSPPTLYLRRSHCVGMHKVMGSSLIMHKEPKTQGGLRSSKRKGGAGSHASAGGAGEQDTEEVSPYHISIFFIPSWAFPSHGTATAVRFKRSTRFYNIVFKR